MAFVVFRDNKRQTIDHDKALHIWNVMCGEEQGSEAQQAYIAKIKRLYLAWDTAPQSYKERYPRDYAGSKVVQVRAVDWTKKYD